MHDALIGLCQSVKSPGMICKLGSQDWLPPLLLSYVPMPKVLLSNTMADLDAPRDGWLLYLPPHVLALIKVPV